MFITFHHLPHQVLSLCHCVEMFFFCKKSTFHHRSYQCPSSCSCFSTYVITFHSTFAFVLSFHHFSCLCSSIWLCRHCFLYDLFHFWSFSHRFHHIDIIFFVFLLLHQFLPSSNLSFRRCCHMVLWPVTVFLIRFQHFDGCLFYIVRIIFHHACRLCLEIMFFTKKWEECILTSSLSSFLVLTIIPELYVN